MCGAVSECAFEYIRVCVCCACCVMSPGVGSCYDKKSVRSVIERVGIWHGVVAGYQVIHCDNIFHVVRDGQQGHHCFFC